MQKLNDEYLRRLYKLISSSPFPHHMRMKLISIYWDQAMVELETSNCHLQPYGIVHAQPKLDVTICDFKLANSPWVN